VQGTSHVLNVCLHDDCKDIAIFPWSLIRSSGSLDEVYWVEERPSNLMKVFTCLTSVTTSYQSSLPWTNTITAGKSCQFPAILS
jgi:hypothetical protein